MYPHDFRARFIIRPLLFSRGPSVHVSEISSPRFVSILCYAHERSVRSIDSTRMCPYIYILSIPARDMCTQTQQNEPSTGGLFLPLFVFSPPCCPVALFYRGAPPLRMTLTRSDSCSPSSRDECQRLYYKDSYYIYIYLILCSSRVL